MRVSVIDYGIGNIQSVANACRRAGAAVSISGNGVQLHEQDPEYILLPGVGAVGAALFNLREKGFDTALDTLVQKRKIPFLGICVGMQVLAEHCFEFGEFRGLGWIPGQVTRLAAVGTTVRLPHVGWNTLHVSVKDDPVFGPLDGEDAYFVHSFAMDCPGSFIAAETEYHKRFVSAVRHGHICGVQFHPEKSAQLGAKLLDSFLRA
jgi:imidazole glycerol-phosphate synthase subunit HisH